MKPHWPVLGIVVIAAAIALLQWNRGQNLREELARLDGGSATPDAPTAAIVSERDSSEIAPAVKQAKDTLEDMSAGNRPGFLEWTEWQDLEIAIAQFPAEQMPEVFDQLLGDGSQNLTTNVIQAIFERWATHDRESAIARAENLSEDRRRGALKGVLTTWVEKDPDAAYAFAKSLAPPEDRGPDTSEPLQFHVIEAVAAKDPQKAIALASAEEWALSKIISIWAMRDPNAALNWLADAEMDPTKSRNLSTLVLRKLAASDPAQTLRHAETSDLGRAKATVIGAALGHLAQKDFDATVGELKNYLEDESIDKIRLLDEFGSFLQNVPPNTLAQFVASLPKGVARDMLINRISIHLPSPATGFGLAGLVSNESTYNETLNWVFREWAKKDAVGASESLAAIEESPAKDNIIKTFSNELLREDPVSAIKWAGSISNFDGRQKQVTRLLEFWIRDDHHTARAWVDQNQAILEQFRTPRQ